VPVWDVDRRGTRRDSIAQRREVLDLLVGRQLVEFRGGGKGIGVDISADRKISRSMPGTRRPGKMES
jgi:hypothetical protein